MGGQGTQRILGENGSEEETNVAVSKLASQKTIDVKIHNVKTLVEYIFDYLEKHVALDSPLYSRRRSLADSEMISDLSVAVSGPEPAHDVGE